MNIKELMMLLILIFLFGFIGCKKDKTEIQDNILFNNISKVIIGPDVDSIQGTCKDLIFEITSDKQIDFSSILRINSEPMICDGYNSIITNSGTKKVSPLNKGFEIFETSNWSGIYNLNLDDFAGQGEKFIGYRSCEYPSGENEYYYGWIKIKLSVNKDTLKIISRALNHTKNKLILTGQK